MTRLHWFGEFLGSLVVHVATFLAVLLWLHASRSGLVAGMSGIFVLASVALYLGLGRRGTLVWGAAVAWVVLLLGASLVGWAVANPYSRASSAQALLQALQNLRHWSLAQLSVSAALIVGPSLAAWVLFVSLLGGRNGERRVA